MRITNNMIFGATTRNAQVHLEKLFNLQKQLASGKKLTRPSDDPTGADRAMLLRGSLNQQTQYQENIRDAATWLNITDGALDEAHALLNRARELAVRGANDTNQQTERFAMAEEVAQLREQLRVVGNSEVNGRFIFGGTRTVPQPPDFVMPYPPVNPGNPIAYTGNAVGMEVEILPGVSLPYNISGQAAFGSNSDPDGAFQVLEALEQALRSDDTDQIRESLERIDRAMTRVSTERAVVGARLNRLDLLENRYADAAISYQERLSETEEPEWAEVIAKLMQAESVYQASLAASSRIIQPSLLDYLR